MKKGKIILALILTVSFTLTGYSNAKSQENQVTKGIDVETNIENFVMPTDINLSYTTTPMFEDVKQVKIYVNYFDGRSREEYQSKPIPEPLKKESIEKLLVGMYDVRFSSEKCGKAIDFYPMRNYFIECNDQPVSLMTTDEYTNYFRDKENLKGNLYVIFNISILGYIKNYHDPAFADAIVTYNIVHARPADALFSDTLLQAFPITQKKEAIEKIMNFSIADNIN